MECGHLGTCPVVARELLDDVELEGLAQVVELLDLPQVELTDRVAAIGELRDESPVTSARSASRTGLRLTPNSAQRASSVSRCSGGYSQAMIRSLSVATMETVRPDRGGAAARGGDGRGGGGAVRGMKGAAARRRGRLSAATR